MVRVQNGPVPLVAPAGPSPVEKIFSDKSSGAAGRCASGGGGPPFPTSLDWGR